MANLINIGVSSLVANKTNLSTTGHNISNANTEGYSRQRALTVTTPAQETSAGYMGTGVTVEGISRMVDLFATNEMRITGDNFNRLDRVLVNSQQLDNMLGEDSTGLAPVMQQFFSALQSAGEDPASVATRQVVLSSSGVLTNRMNELSARFDGQNAAINTQFDTMTAEATVLARNIARINEQLAVNAGSPVTQLPNDLLDERDRVVQELAEIINIQVVEDNKRAMNIYVGQGQPLVVGNRSFTLESQPGKDDASRHDIVYTNGRVQQIMTDQVTGGKLGGLVEFRTEILDESYGQLGIVALSLTEAMNEQHRLGMDLDGQLGGDIFRDINDARWSGTRVQAQDSNYRPGTERIDVTIEDASALTTSDYRLRFSPESVNSYSVVRLSDGETVATKAFSGTFPSDVAFDGVEVTINAGEFAAGDSFLISPSRFAAREIAVGVENVRDLAFAQPLRIEGNEANRGTGVVVDQGIVSDVTSAMFSQIEDTQQLNPPLLIRFTSATTYEILDNSDPANPVDMVPPLSQMKFVPGLKNTMMPADNDQQVVISDRPNINQAIRNTVLNSYENGYGADTVEVTSVDPETRVISSQEVTTTAQDSAANIAAQLNTLDNVNAKARNFAILDEINSTSPMTLTINNQNFALNTPNQLAVLINQNPQLAAAGITAKSNGNQVELESTTGEDFNIAVAGGASDSLTVAGRNGAPILLTGTDPIPQVTLGGHIDVTLDEGSTMNGSNGVFNVLPTHYPSFLGVQLQMGGSPVEGDTFELNFNAGGFSDNRNVAALSALQAKKIMSGGEATLRDTYANLVDFVGTRTKEAELGQEAANTLFERARNEREAVSGVNLDEEAGNVIKFQQAFNASAQLIAVARSIFDTLLQSMR